MSDWRTYADGLWLAHVLDPADDLTRLAMADWIDEYEPASEGCYATALRQQKESAAYTLYRNIHGGISGEPLSQDKTLYPFYGIRLSDLYRSGVHEFSVQYGTVRRICLTMRRWLESAKSLALGCPLEYVNIIDASPISTPLAAGRYHWIIGDKPWEGQLPKVLFYNLPFTGCRESQGECLDDLSVACIRYAHDLINQEGTNQRKTG